MKIITNELAEKQAYKIVATLCNPASYDYYFNDFPGCDVLGLNPDKSRDKRIADAIVYAIQAGNNQTEIEANNTCAYGQLLTMLQYGLVSYQNILQAIHHRNNLLNQG